MREIKFRAWHKEDKRFIDLNGFEIAFKGFRNQGAVTDVIEQGNLSMIDVDDVELLQCTGLKDKNGVELYEVDILECAAGIYWIVKFINGCFCACDPNEDENFVFLDDYDFEVIGNIYENPELLEN